MMQMILAPTLRRLLSAFLVWCCPVDAEWKKLLFIFVYATGERIKKRREVREWSTKLLKGTRERREEERKNGISVIKRGSLRAVAATTLPAKLSLVAPQAAPPAVSRAGTEEPMALRRFGAGSIWVGGAEAVPGLGKADGLLRNTRLISWLVLFISQAHACTCMQQCNTAPNQIKILVNMH